MPRPKRRERVLALDTEATGLDLHHIARPFFVSFCDDDGANTSFEWDIDPLTRLPIVPSQELDEIQDLIDSADLLVLQNAGFDVKALQTVFNGKLRWDWGKVRDTLIAGHLLASNQPHDLTSMALTYLNINIKPLEDSLLKAVNEARTIARRKYPSWFIAKKGLPGMPSAKEKVSSYDYWLPRAIAKAEGYPSGGCTVVNKRADPFDIYIGRGSRWGNPFVIGKDGSREEVIEKYRRWVIGQSWFEESLKELDGRVLGCFCKPLPCHGDFLAEEVNRRAHPWWTVLREYAEADPFVTLKLYRRQEELLKEKGLWRIYEFKMKVSSVIYGMEQRGITISKERTEELEGQYRESSARLHRVCVNLADREIEKLPKNGSSNDLKKVLFEKFALRPTKITDKGNPSVDRFVLDDWLATLPQRGKPYLFVKSLRAYRKRQTALGYIESYKKFWLPLSHSAKDWMILYPSVNETGTGTLRMSSSNPNEQQISKQEVAEIGEHGHNARYMFGPAPGREWWSCDCKNIELRIPAYEAGERAMIDLFERPDDPPYFGSNHLLFFDILHPDMFKKHGKDVKKVYADSWYQWTKNGDFAVQYGAMAESGTADRAYHVPGAQAKIENRLTRIKALSQRMIKYAEKTSYVETMPDRTVDSERGYPLFCTRTKWGGVKPTVPLSYHVQGTAMWVMCRMMVKVQEYLDRLNRDRKGGYYIIIQVHDELVFDFPFRPNKGNLPIIRKVKEIMDSVGDDLVPRVPLPVGIEYHPLSWEGGETLA